MNCKIAIIYKRILEQIVQFNIYTYYESLDLAQQILATRIYTGLFATVVFVLLIFTGSISQTRVYTVSSPSLDKFERLSRDYSSTLVCPCSKIAIKFNKFVTFDPGYHQVCSSKFVSDEWIFFLFNDNMSNYYPLDFRLVASSQFQMLASFCRAANRTVTDSVEQFLSSDMISSSVIFRSIFDIHMATLVDQLQWKMNVEFNRINLVVSLSMNQNLIFSGLRTNFYLIIKPGSPTNDWYWNYFSNGNNTYNTSIIVSDGLDGTCSCYDTFDCSSSAGIFNGSRATLMVPDQLILPYPPPIYFIPGMQTGCMPQTSLLSSTLECFFNVTCLQLLMDAFNNSIDISPLNGTLGLSQFSPTSTVKDIFNNIMLESLHNKSNFQRYFDACAPKSCTYSRTQRFDTIYMFTTLVSLIGGLSGATNVLSLSLVRLLTKRKKVKNLRVVKLKKPGPKERVHKYFQNTRRWLVEFNIFKKKLAHDDHGIYSTRVYIILLLLSILILTIYSTVIQRTISVTVDDPTLDTFEQLHKKYPSTLSCPCKHISMTYESIMSIQPRYHQICTSDFIRDDAWLTYWPLTYINLTNDAASFLFGSDFRYNGKEIFQQLQLFCGMANEIIKNTKKAFDQTLFLSAKPLSRADFTAQTFDLFSQFQHQVMESFSSLFNLTYNSVRLNQFVVMSATNAAPKSYKVIDHYELRYQLKTLTGSSTSCSCGASILCLRPQGFYCSARKCHLASSVPNRTIPGLYIGCFQVDSVLLSTLECLFDQSCVQMMIDWRLFDYSQYYLPVNLNYIQALNASIPSQYFPNTTLERIISQLFIEEWIQSVDYASHYAQCQPKFCIYTIVGKQQLIFILTSIVGLIGGLQVVFRILIPPVVKIIQHIATNLSGYSIVWLFRYLTQFIRTFNIYEKKIATSHHQLLASRSYLAILLICISIISLFVGISQQTHSYTIDSPSQAQFEYVYSKYSSTLACPCSKISIPYDKFLNISPVIHNICSSYFVTTNWSTTLFNFGSTSSVPDWFIITTQFRLLSSLCTIAKNFINQSIYDILSNRFVTTEAISAPLFQEQIDSIIQGFLKQMPITFHHTLSFIIDAYQSNQLQDIFMSNWKFTHSGSDEYYVLRTVPKKYNNNTCICAAGMSTCSRPLDFSNTANSSITFPGFNAGCLILLGLQLSIFECLYDQKCLDKLTKLMKISTSVSALEMSDDSQYSPNSTLIGSIIDNLFIERWSKSMSYSSYFEECAIVSCTYSYIERNDVLYIFTTLLGLYGGLTIALRFLVWYGIDILHKFRFRKVQIAPQ